MNNSLRTVFMGSPDFAVPSLRALIDGGYDVVGVITQPDKPKGRSQKLTPPPVKVAAEELGIPVHQPKTLRDEAFYSLLSEDLKPELIIVAAYGKMLPTNVLEYPKYGCINVHASLLPLYRGADPIRRALIDRREVTGVTIMMMAEGCDTGDMLDRSEYAIKQTDNCETLTSELSLLGASLLIPTLERYISGELEPTPQDDACTCQAPKLSDDEIKLDFSKPACCSCCLVRACVPAPVAETTLDGKRLKITAVKVHDTPPVEFPSDAVCGYVMTTKKAIYVKCGEGILELLELIPEGRKPMNAAAFLNGRGIASGTVLGE